MNNYYQNPYMQQYQPNLYTQPAQSQGSLNWVQGETGAKSWLVGRGETVLLMDSENPVFYLKSSDSAGMPLPLRVFDYTERTEAPNSKEKATDEEFVTHKDIDEIWGKYEELKAMIEDMQKPKTTRKKEGASDE